MRRALYLGGIFLATGAAIAMAAPAQASDIAGHSYCGNGYVLDCDDDYYSYQSNQVIQQVGGLANIGLIDSSLVGPIDIL